MSSSKYNSEVKDWLKEIGPGWRVIDDICRPENINLFVNAVKAYIDEGGMDIYFSSDYKKIRKIEIPKLMLRNEKN